MARYGSDGNDLLESKSGWWIFGNYEETLYGYRGDDTLKGGDRDDNLYGDEDNDDLYGYKGSDYLYGGQGDDILYGNQGDDYLNGGDGDDDLDAGEGYDTLTGGTGADYFIFDSPTEGIDTITDFYFGEGDKIEISADGFGIGTTEYNRFFYDSNTGALYFDNQQLAWLNTDSDFNTISNIVIV
ncbi:calcium-binding protein [Lyngbya aestuarii]|uniref:calcium-binding protein n=1 Tax=Lyngbya aestuarii TaxID=118322 RepID=UPI00403E342C